MNKIYLLPLLLFFFLSCKKENLTILQSADIHSAALDSLDKYRNDSSVLKFKVQEYSGNGNLFLEMKSRERLGNYYRNISRFPEAIQEHRKAHAISVQLKDTTSTIQTLNNLGTDFRRIGAMAEASEYHFKALNLSAEQRIFEETLNLKNQAIACNGIGNISLSLERPQESEEFFRRALEIEKKLESPLGMAINFANLGSVLLNRNDFDSARFFFEQSLEQNKLIRSDLGIALCHNHLGDVYFKQKQYILALNEYKTSYDLMENNPDIWHFLTASLAIAKVNIELGKDNIAEQFLLKTISKAEIIESKEILMKSYLLLSELHRREGQHQKALNELTISNEYEKAIRNNNQLNLFIDLRLKNEHTKNLEKLRELQSLSDFHKEQNQLSQTLMYLFIFLFITAVIYFWFRYKFIQTKNEEERKLDKIKFNFFTNITHEFRTPLTIILGLTKQLITESGEFKSIHKKFLNAVHRQGENMLLLVNQMLDIAKSEAGSNKNQWKYGDLAGYINLVAGSFESYLEQLKINLVILTNPLELKTDFIPGSITKILSNLISNAAKNSNPGSRIVVQLDKINEKNCKLTISDEGKGISADDLPKIFERFYQTADSEQNSLGSGIGLALTKQLVNEMKGVIAVESILHKGTVFTIIFPIASSFKETQTNDTLLHEIDATEISMYTAVNNEGLESPSLQSKKSKTVLVVDDNPDMLAYISGLLSKTYNILNANNGEEGLEMAFTHLPDLIISDLMMPVKDGISFCKQLREKVKVNHIPVILITARNEKDDRILALNAGADDYMVKPFDEEELFARVSQLLTTHTRLKDRFSDLQWQNDKIDQLKQNEKELLIKLSSLISSNLENEAYFPDLLAGDMNYSLSQLRKKVKDITGNTLSFYIMEIRLNTAKKLLKESNQSIGDISVACGFSDLGYFSRSFKEFFGYTPSQYLKLPETQK